VLLYPKKQAILMPKMAQGTSALHQIIYRYNNIKVRGRILSTVGSCSIPLSKMVKNVVVINCVK